MLSSDPERYPIEPGIVPLVFALRGLRVFEPCWSCEGHDATACDLEGAIPYGGQPAEALDQIVDLQHRGAPPLAGGSVRGPLGHDVIELVDRHPRERGLAVHGLERIAIVDFDVHRSNGTEAIFRGVEGVWFASIHQSFLFPDGGEGNGASAKNILNI